MNLIVSSIDCYNFTNSSQNNLRELGFEFSSNLNKEEEEGIEIERITLPTNLKENFVDLRLITILNEETFLLQNKNQEIKPRLQFNSTLQNPNSIQSITMEGIFKKIIGIYLGPEAQTEYPQTKENCQNVRFLFGKEMDPLYTYFKIRKKSSLWAVIILCQDLTTLSHQRNLTDEYSFQGQKALLMKQNPNMWDLIFIEKNFD